MNGTQRYWLYFLVDGIYVRWSIFVKPRQAPADAKEKLFNSTQEAARKCVERGFGQLVAQFEILKNPIRNWHMDDIKNILYCCIIVHNMVTAERRSTLIDADVMPEEEAEAEAEDEEGNGNGISFFGFQAEPSDPSVTTRLGNMVAHMVQNVEDTAAHDRLMVDLIEHVWTTKTPTPVD